MLGLEAIAKTGLLVLASSAVECVVPEAPQITVSPASAPIAYEYNLSGLELDKLKSNTVNPYAPDTDTTTGGLRQDKPEIRTEITWGSRHYPDRDVVCMWYKTVKVSINLNPKIYIASENKDSPACREAIRGHELKHVELDRKIINQYAKDIGESVKDAVDRIGAMGPYNSHQQEDVKEKLIQHIETAVDSHRFLLYQDMSKRQATIDSYDEYQRVNAICEKEE